MCESHSALSGTDTGVVLLLRHHANSCVRAGRRFVCLFVCFLAGIGVITTPLCWFYAGGSKDRGDMAPFCALSDTVERANVFVRERFCFWEVAVGYPPLC